MNSETALANPIRKNSKGVLVHVKHHHVGGVHRPAASHYVNDRERVLGGAQDPQNQHEERGRHQQRDHHVAERGYRIGPVNPGGFLQLRRYPLQSRQIDDSEIADLPPNEGDDHGRHRQDRVRSPAQIVRQPDQLQQGVDDAELRVEDPEPDYRGGDQRGDHRRVVESSQQRLRPDPLVQRQRGSQRTADHDRDRGHHEHECIPHRAYEVRFGDQLGEVVNPDELGRFEGV